MGKNLIQQRSGKGSTTFRAPSHRFKAEVLHRPIPEKIVNGVIKDIINCPGHTAPLIEVRYEDGVKTFKVAPEGLRIGDVVSEGKEADVRIGNTLPLSSIPEGTYICNIELQPGDGGKFVRASGTFARIITKVKKSVIVQLPSKKERAFSPECRATIGMVAGSGRVEKPFLKAGKKFHKMHARNRWYPDVGGTKMNAADHPYGGSRSLRKGRPTIAPRFAPPGRKVGKIRPRRTGRKRRR